MTHSKESWEAKDGAVTPVSSGIRVGDPRYAIIQDGEVIGGFHQSVHALEAVACVNALTGVDNQVKAMELVRDVLGGLVKRNKTVLGDAIGHSTLDEIHKALAAITKAKS